jgi:hypothetical protein
MKHFALESIDSKASLVSVLIARDKLDDMSDDDVSESEEFN